MDCLLIKKLKFMIKENDTYEQTCLEVPAWSIVLVEGVFLQRPEIRKYFDYVVYIEMDKATRLGRVLERDTYIGSKEEIALKYEKRYFPAEQKYIDECKPIDLANFIKP